MYHTKKHAIKQLCIVNFSKRRTTMTAKNITNTHRSTPSELTLMLHNPNHSTPLSYWVFLSTKNKQHPPNCKRQEIKLVEDKVTTFQQAE